MPHVGIDFHQCVGRHLLSVHDDVLAGKPSVDCLVNSVCFGICAFLYPDREFIPPVYCLISILGQHSESIEPSLWAKESLG